MTNFTQQNATGGCCTECEEANDKVLELSGILEIDSLQNQLIFDQPISIKDTLVIRSADPELQNAVLRAPKIFNEGTLICEVDSLTLETLGVYGAGETRASQIIKITSLEKHLSVIGGRFISEIFQPECDGNLDVRAQRIEGQIELTACEVSVGVSEGELIIARNTVTGDPIYFNTGSSITVPAVSSNGSDIFVWAKGDVTTGALNSTGGGEFLPGRINIVAGMNFKNPGFQASPLGCANCFELVASMPNEFETNPGRPEGKVTINGDLLGKSIFIHGGEIKCNGKLHALGGYASGPGAGIIMIGNTSVTVTGKITTDQLVWPASGNLAIFSPIIDLKDKVSTDHMFLGINEDQSGNGSFKTRDIKCLRTLFVNTNLFVGEGDGSLVTTPAPIPGTISVKMGDLTVRESICMFGSGTITTGDIKLIKNDFEHSAQPHDVRIHANINNQNAATMSIGGSNGPKSIEVHGTYDYPGGFFNKTGVVFISNGPDGNILLDCGKIRLMHKDLGIPPLIVNAGKGRITMKGTTLNLDGSDEIHAGCLALMASEIVVPTRLSITAQDNTENLDNLSPKIVFSTSKILLAGDLTLKCKSAIAGQVVALSEGNFILDPLKNAAGNLIRFREIEEDDKKGLLEVSGSGKFLVNVTGATGKIRAVGNPIRFAATGDIVLLADGVGSEIRIDYAGTSSGERTLILSGKRTKFDVSNSEGDAGQIFIRAEGIENYSDLEIRANGGATGNGGGVQIESSSAETGIFNLSAVTIDASGGEIEGSGGAITIAGHSIEVGDVLDKVAFSANGVGSGKGGNINLRSMVDMDVSGLRIEATGGTSGAGGDVTVSKASNVVSLFPVNLKIESNSNDLQIGDGSVSLNGVTLYQHRTAFSWPKTWWGSSSPSDAEEGVYLGAFRVTQAKFINTLSNNHYALLALKDISAWESFLALEVPKDEIVGISGRSGQNLSQAGFLVSAAFMEIQRENGIEPNVGVEATILHEIGHAIDYVDHWSDTFGWIEAYAADTVGLESDLNTKLNEQGIRVSRPCREVFSEGVCEEFEGEGVTNWNIYQKRFSKLNDRSELFAIIFQRNEGDISPSLDLKSASSFMSNMNNWMQVFFNS